MALAAPLKELLVERNMASGIRLLLPEPKYDNQSIELAHVVVVGNSLSPAAPLVSLSLWFLRFVPSMRSAGDNAVANTVLAVSGVTSPCRKASVLRSNLLVPAQTFFQLCADPCCLCTVCQQYANIPVIPALIITWSCFTVPAGGRSGPRWLHIQCWCHHARCHQQLRLPEQHPSTASGHSHAAGEKGAFTAAPCTPALHLLAFGELGKLWCTVVAPLPPRCQVLGLQQLALLCCRAPCRVVGLDEEEAASICTVYTLPAITHLCCTVKLQGGGVCIQGPAQDSSDDVWSQHGFLQKLSIFMTRTQIEGNMAAEGGGLWTAWPMIIEDCIFANNHALVSVSHAVAILVL